MARFTPEPYHCAGPTCFVNGGIGREGQSKMIYVKWTQSELATLRTPALYTEVDEDGWVQRELAVTDDGTVADQLIPSLHRPGWFGLARLSPPMLQSNVTKAEFETLWQSGTSHSMKS